MKPENKDIDRNGVWASERERERERKLVAEKKGAPNFKILPNVI